MSGERNVVALRRAKLWVERGIVYQEMILWTPLPGMNKIIAESKRRYKSKTSRRYHYAYAKMKKALDEALTQEFLLAGLKPIKNRLRMTLHFYQKRPPNSSMKDPDNIEAGARKMVLDALQKAGIIRGDDWFRMALPRPFGESHFERCDGKSHTVMILEDHPRPDD